MATQNRTLAPRGGWGLRRYHVGFALAFGVGAALLPPDGTLTIAGWVGGALGAVVAGLLAAGVVVGGFRVAEDWRPSFVVDPEIPNSRTRHAVFAAVVLQLFAFGLGTTAGLSTEGMLFFAGPVNVLIGAAVALDIAALRKRGLHWDTVAYGYAVAGLVLGFVGGLAYWRARGRKRAEHAHPAGGHAGQGGQGGQPPQGGPQQGGQPPQGGPQQGGQPPQGGQGRQGRQPPQGGGGQPRQGGQGQPQQGGGGQPPQGGQGQPRQGGQGPQGQDRRSQQGSRGTQPRDGQRQPQRGGRGESPPAGPEGSADDAADGTTGDAASPEADRSDGPTGDADGPDADSGPEADSEPNADDESRREGDDDA